MDNGIMMKTFETHHNGMMQKSIKVNQPHTRIWKEIKHVGALESWGQDIKKVTIQSESDQGIKAKRKIIFKDNNTVTEIIVGWKENKYFSYIATSGLPLRSYHATISLEPLKESVTRIVWKSYFDSKEDVTRIEFDEFIKYLEEFYKKSLIKLKRVLEVE